MTSPDLPPNLPYSPVGTPPPDPGGGHHKTPAHTSPGEVPGNPGDPPNGPPPLSSLSKERGGGEGAPSNQTEQTPPNGRRLIATSAAELWKRAGYGDWRKCKVTPPVERTLPHSEGT